MPLRQTCLPCAREPSAMLPLWSCQDASTKIITAVRSSPILRSAISIGKKWKQFTAGQVPDSARLPYFPLLGHISKVGIVAGLRNLVRSQEMPPRWRGSVSQTLVAVRAGKPCVLALELGPRPSGRARGLDSERAAPAASGREKSIFADSLAPRASRLLIS